ASLKLKITSVAPLALLAAASVAGCSVQTPTVTTTGSPAGTPAASLAGTSQTPSAPPTPASSQAATVGTSITLAGFNSGEKMAVTVVQVFSHATGADSFTSPDPGKQFYAVQFRLSNVGSAAYSDAPDNSAQVIDASGQSYTADVDSVSQC